MAEIQALPFLGQDTGPGDPITQKDIIGLDEEASSKMYNLFGGPKETHNQLQANPVYRGKVTGNLEGFIPTIDNKEYFAAHNQNPMELLGNAIGQLGSEVVLGTIEAVGYLADIPGWVEAWKSGEVELDNELSKWAREAKQTINQELIPIHESPWSEGFNPASGRWWAKNSGTLGTALSLMIPSGFVGKAAGTALKGARLSQTTKIATQGMAAAMVSRHAESLMEANQVHDELIAQGMSEEQASQAAAKSYRDNVALLATDFFQYAFLFKAGSKELAKTFSRAKGAKPSVILEGIKQAPFEAAEEGYQFITAEESKKIASGEVEGDTIWGKGIAERFTDYFKDEEFWNSAFMGAVTGIAMPVAMDGVSYAYDRIMGVDKKKEEANMMEEVASLGEETESQYFKDRKFMSLAFKHASNGTVEELENTLKARLEEVDGDEHAKIQGYLEDLPAFEEIFNRVQNRPDYTRGGKFENIEDTNRELKTQMILNAWDLRKTSNFQDQLNHDYDEMIGQLPESELPSDLREIKRLHALNALYDSPVLNSIYDHPKSKEARAKQIKQELEEAIKAYPKDLSNENLNSLLSTSIDDKILRKLIRLEESHEKLRNLKKDIELSNSAAGQQKLLEKIDKKRGDEKREYEEYLSNFLGDGVVINKEDDKWDIRPNEDKFELHKHGNPDIPGTVDPFTDEEYDQFIKTSNVSEGRLGQIANKVKNGEELTRKERAVHDTKREEIGALIATNKNNNSGKGFSRIELMDWMMKNGYKVFDDTLYRNKLEQSSINERRKEIAEKNADLTNALANKEATYQRLAETLTGKPEDSITIKGMDRILDEISRIKSAIRSNEIELASLNQPTAIDRRAYRQKAHKYESAAEEFFGKKIDQLQQEKRSLTKVSEKLERDANTLREIYRDIKQGFQQRLIKPKQYYSDLREVKTDIAKNDEELNKVKENLDQIEQDVQYYKTHMDDIAGERLIERQNELNNILSGTDTTRGLRGLLAEAIAARDNLEKKVNDITDDLLKFFDVPKDKLNDEAFINETLNAAEKLNDEDINELVKEARKKEQYKRLLNTHNQEIKDYISQVQAINKELADYNEIERMAYPKVAKPKYDRTQDIEMISDPVEFTPKKSAEEAFNFLRGRHFDGNTITDLEHAQRYFKFVESNSFVGNKFYIKLVPYAINGNPTEWSVLLSDVEKQRMQEYYGDRYEEVLNDMIFAVVVDQDKRPVNLYREQIQSDNPIDVFNYGIFTTYPNSDTSTEYNNGERYLGTPEELEASKQNFLRSREGIRENLNNNTAVYLPATSKSVGLPIEDERKPIAYTLINPNKAEVNIAKRNELVFQGRNFNVKQGTVYVRDLTSGQVNQAYSRKLNEQEQETIFQLFRLAQEFSYEDNPFDSLIPGVNKSIKEVLSEYIFYGTNGYLYEKTDPKANKFTGQVHLKDLGFMDLKDLVNSSLALKNWIKNQYHQVRSTSDKDTYHRVVWNGDKFTTIKHDNYQAYLLDPDLGILESTLPAYEDDVSKPQRKNSNVYFDYDNVGYDEVPTKESTKVPKSPTPKTPTPQKPKPPKPVSVDFSAAAADMLGEVGGEFTGSDKPQVLPKEDAKKAFGRGAVMPKKKFNSGKSRTIRVDNQYVFEDLPQAEAWFKERFPNVDFQVAYGLAKSGAWGRFTQHGQVLVDPYAEEGTVYHESFHVVMGLYLSPRERQALLSEARKGLKEELTDAEVEEVLAEGFRDYVLTGETVYDNKSNNFFTKLLTFLKWILGLNKPSVQEVFDNIVNGYYANLTPDYSRLHEDKNRSFTDKDATFTRDVIDGVNYMFWNSAPEGRLIEEIISKEIPGEILKDIYDNVRNSLQEQINYLYDLLDSMSENDPQYNQAYKLLEAREWIVENFNSQVIPAHQEYLSTFNIDVEVPELPLDEEEVGGIDQDNEWSEASGEISGKKSVSNQVKLWLSIIPKVYKDSNGEVIHQTNSLEFEVFEDFTKMFGILSNKLADTTNTDEMVDEIKSLTKLMPATVKLNEYFFLNTPSERLSGSQMQRKMQFFQAFAKGRDLFSRIIVNPSGDHAYIEVSTAGQRRKMINDWDANFTSTILQETADKLAADATLSFNEAINQAAAIGMDIQNPYLLDELERIQFAENMTWIADYVQKGNNPYRGRERTEYDPSLGENVTYWEPSNVQGRVDNMIELAYKTTVDPIENSHITYNGKTRYDNSQYTYHKYVNSELNKIAENIKLLGLSKAEGYELIYDRFPHLNNPYTAGSSVLDKIASGQSLQTRILDGLGTEGSGSREFSKTHFQDNFLSQFNNTLGGRYHMLRPADNKQERLFHWGLFMGIEEIETNVDDIAAPINLMLEYLKAEAITLKDANVGNTSAYSIWSNLGNNLRLDSYPKYYQDAIDKGSLTPDHVKLVQSGILLSIISSPEVMPILESFVLEDISLDDFIYNPVVVDRMTQWFNYTLNQRVLPTLREVKLDPKLQHEYKEFPIETVAKLFMINYIAGNIEQTKIFTGHPAQYKSLDDFFKRMSGMVGTKTLPSVTDDTNRYLIGNGLGKEEPIIRTAVIQDPVVKSRYGELYEEILRRRYDQATAANKIENFYNSIEESDAQGYISLDEYREFKFRIGEWDWKQEAAYQWETQEGWKGSTVTVPKNNPYSEIAGQEITRDMVEQKGFFLTSMKPQYFGPLKDADFFVNSYYKLSLLPLLPSMIQGRNLEEVNNKMKKQKIGILVFSTGNKLGTRLGDATNESIPGVQTMYDQEGNIKPEVLLTQDTFYEYWGIQVNNAPKQKYQVSSGTQFLKQIESNLFFQGVPKDFQEDRGDRQRNWLEMSESDRLAESPTYRKIKELRKLNKARQSTGARLLAFRLGLEEEEMNGEKIFSIQKSKLPQVQEFLQKQFVARDLPENMIDSVRWIDRGIDFMVNREKVENILFAIADKMTVSQKKHGKSSVQVSSTFFETEGKRDYDDGKFSSSDLNFYNVEYIVGNKRYTPEEWSALKEKPEDYQISIGEMEVYLPHYFREMLGEEVDIRTLDQRLLSAVGFRIPTQGLNSIENIKIKGFLPALAGDIVVVPSEIIAKAGSDFDFDKLFLHFPNYEMENGQPRYLEFTRSASKVWDKRKRSFTLSIPEYAAEIDKIETEFKNDISTALIGKNISFELWSKRILPRIQSFGIEADNIREAIYAAKNYITERENGISLGILSSLSSDIEFDKNVEVLNDIIVEAELVLRSIKSKGRIIHEAKVKRDEALEQVYDKAFESFDQLNIYEKNGKAAIENEMLRLHKELLSDYQRFDEIINPISTDTFKGQADIINRLKGKNANPQELYNIVDPVFVVNKGIEFQHAKQNIGRAALNATSHILFSQADVFLNLPRNKRIYLNHNTSLQGGQIRPSLAGLKTADGKHYISDLLSEMINAYVDAAKDPFIFQINGGPLSSNVLFLMLRLGVPVNEAIAFINQPIIDEYLKGLGGRRSTYFYTTGKTDWDFVNRLTKKYNTPVKPKNPEKVMKSLTSMRNMIEKVGNGQELTDAEKASQLAILDQYLELEDISDSVRNAIWGTAYDTAAAGKNTGELIHRLKLTERSINENLLGNYGRIFDNGSFLEPFYSSVKELVEMMTPYMITLGNPGIRSQFDKFLSLTLDEYGYDKIINAMKAEMFTYIVHKQLNLNDFGNLIYSYTTVDGQKVRNTTVPMAVQQYKNQVTRGEAPYNEFIDALSVKLAIKDPTTKIFIDSLSLNSGTKTDKEDSDIYTQEWRKLMNTHPILAENLATFLWIQSGLQNSPNNFIDLVPNEIYANIMDKALNNLSQEPVDFKNFYHEFFFNNTQAGMWKTVGSVRAIKDSWPAYKVRDNRGMAPSTTFYFNGSQISKDKMKTIRNFRNDSSKKYFPDADFSEYVMKRNKFKPAKPAQEARKNEIDDILNQEDCGL